jgi:hypothetical protein
MPLTIRSQFETTIIVRTLNSNLSGSANIVAVGIFYCDPDRILFEWTQSWSESHRHS